MTDKYILSSDGSSLVLNPDYKGIARFGGVEYLANHDRVFGSGSEDHGFGDVGLCMLLLMEDFPAAEPVVKLEDFTKLHIDHLRRKSQHVEKAVGEIYDMVNKSRYYAAKQMIKRKADVKCATELKHEERALQKNKKPL